MNLFTKHRLTELKNKLMAAKVKEEGKGELGSLGWTCAEFKMDNQQGPTVWHMELCSVL